MYDKLQAEKATTDSDDEDETACRLTAWTCMGIGDEF
jgi:hypothetical protein